MAWRGEELFVPLLLFFGLSVVFIYCDPISSASNLEWIPDTHGYFFLLGGALKQLRFHILGFFTCFMEILSEQMKAILITSGEWLSNIRNMIVLSKDVIENLTLYTLIWLNTCKMQHFCYIVIMYLVYTTYKENVVYSRLVEDLKMLQGIINHHGWQVGVQEPEMDALAKRLVKNRDTRIPELRQQLDMLYSMIDLLNTKYLKLEDELAVWKPRINNETNKLQKLNNMLRQEIDSEVIREIRSVGCYAGQRVAKTAKDLHGRIDVVKSVLEETSKLMDIKGLPMRVDYSIEEEC